MGPVKLTQPGMDVPEKKAIIFFVDGLNREVFNTLLDANELPQIKKYLVQRGIRVENAVTVAPSITYAATTTFITGQVPGHHGIMGNKFFDRDRYFLADYSTIETYRDTDKHYQSPTIYEILNDKYSVSIQVAIRRGVYLNIDNWATSGIRWYFNQIPEIDALTAERFKMIGEISRQAGRWPDLIFSYFPAVDEMGHRFGTASKQYHAAIKNIDEQIGRICIALETNDLLDSTTLFFVVDHGMASCRKERHFDLEELLEHQFDLVYRLAEHGPDLKTHFGERVAYFNKYKAVLIRSGDRQAMLYLRNGTHWQDLASPEQVEPVAKFISQQKAVALVAYRGLGGVVIQNSRGRGLIRCEDRQDGLLNENRQSYAVIDGEDPLGYAGVTRAGQLMDGQYHTSQEWLEATIDTQFPDAPVAMSGLFDSRRTGDVMVFAADGWDFGPKNLAGHGSLRRDDMLVPMIIAGPGMKAGGTIKYARIVDIAPTVVEVLGGEKQDTFDGVSLLPQLMKP